MNVNPNQRPTVNELFETLDFLNGKFRETDKFIYKGKDYLKKLIKRYRMFQPHMKKILMLFNIYI